MKCSLKVAKNTLKAVGEGLGVPDIGLHKKTTLDTNEVGCELSSGLKGFSNEILHMKRGPHHQWICPWAEKSLCPKDK
jgi:hypothetical protein